MAQQQSLIDIAKAPTIAYGEKNWEAVKASVAPSLVYEEVATGKKIQGVEEVLKLWRGWATALPDSKATFHNIYVSGNNVVVEVTWRGTHNGPLQAGEREIAPTGKQIEVRSCQVIACSEGKVQSMRQYFDMGTILKQIGIG